MKIKTCGIYRIFRGLSFSSPAAIGQKCALFKGLNIYKEKSCHGFTFIELIIAVTISFLIVSSAFGLYRKSTDDFNRISSQTESYFKNLRLKNLIKKICSKMPGDIIMGDKDQVVFISGANITGFGNEIIRIEKNNESEGTIISVTPLYFISAAAGLPEKEILYRIFNDDLEIDYIHEERFSDLICSFVYDEPIYDETRQEERSESDFHKTEYFRADFENSNKEKFIISVSK